MSYRPRWPLRGSHLAREKSNGVRGNDPGGHSLPRSRRQTSSFSFARRYVMTEPPKPEPTTTASNSSSYVATSVMLGRDLRFLRGEDACELRTRAQPAFCVRRPEPLLDRLRREEELPRCLLVRRAARHDQRDLQLLRRQLRRVGVVPPPHVFPGRKQLGR